MHKFDEEGSLMRTTREMMKDLDLFELHHATKISFYWLKKFRSGAFKNPSVNRVEYLYEHLTGRELILK